MTDTTDIKALLNELRVTSTEKAGESEVARRVLILFDQLEAERQRADVAQADMQFECDAHIETAESWREWKLRAVTAEAEIAALKTDIESYISISGELATEVEALKAKLALKSEKLADCDSALDKAQTLLMPDGLHENTKALVIGFANAMAAKLYKSEQKYGWSDAWLQDDWQDKCLADFNHHISKGDPLDVANYCMFMHYHGWPTALKGDQVPVAWRFKNQSGEYRVSIEKKPNTYGRTDFEPLFTAQQKPVVTLGYIKISEVVAAVSLEQNRKWNGRVGYMAGWNACIDAAIEAAGGVVKDGE
jgi:hypothetical protein